MIELIDKNKAIKKLAFAQEQMYKAIGGVEDDTYKTLDTIQFCIDRIDEIEAEKVEIVKHGQWVKNNDRYGWHCSQCKKDNVYAYHWTESNVLELQDNYCPKCGARMAERRTDD